MKKLYEVKIKLHIMAENEDEAISVAFGPDVDPWSCDVEVCEPGSAYAHCKNLIPLNSDDDKTVGQVFQERRSGD